MQIVSLMNLINMSSILVSELKAILENVPEDYEVIMEIRTGCDTKAGTSIAYINGVRRDEEFKEIRGKLYKSVFAV